MGRAQNLSGKSITSVAKGSQEQGYDISKIQSPKALKALAEINLILSSIDIQELLAAFREENKSDLLIGVKALSELPASTKNRTELTLEFANLIEGLPGFKWIKREVESHGLHIAMSKSTYDIGGKKIAQTAFIIASDGADLKRRSYRNNAIMADCFYYQECERGPLGSGRPKFVRRIVGGHAFGFWST